MKWFQIVAKTLGALVAIALLAVAIHFTEQMLLTGCKSPAAVASNPISCVDFWLNRYQTLVSGLIALFAAWLTVRTIRHQMLHSERIARRLESENESVIREIIVRRTGILSEAWKAIDWALDGKDAATKWSRSELMNGTYWH